jgi:hypothetical protein
MPLVIIYVISHVTFITTMTFITITLENVIKNKLFINI